MVKNSADDGSLKSKDFFGWIGLIITLSGSLVAIYAYAANSYVSIREMEKHQTSDKEILDQRIVPLEKRLERMENKIDLVIENQLKRK
jgi:hypothetical protein